MTPRATRFTSLSRMRRARTRTLFRAVPRKVRFSVRTADPVWPAAHRPLRPPLSCSFPSLPLAASPTGQLKSCRPAFCRAASTDRPSASPSLSQLRRRADVPPPAHFRALFDPALKIGRIMKQFVVLALAAAAGAASAQTGAQRDPLEAAAAAPKVQFSSAFAGYQPYADQEPAAWRALNDEAGRVGGHVGYVSGAKGSKNSEDRPAASPSAKPPPRPEHGARK